MYKTNACQGTEADCAILACIEKFQVKSEWSKSALETHLNTPCYLHWHTQRSLLMSDNITSKLSQ